MSFSEKKEVISNFVHNIPNRIVKRLEILEGIQDRVLDEIDTNCPFNPAISNKSRQIWEKKGFKSIQFRYTDESAAKQAKIEKQKLKLQQEIEKSLKKDSIFRTTCIVRDTEDEGSFVTKNLFSSFDEHAPRRERSANPSFYQSQINWLQEKSNKILETQMQIANSELDYIDQSFAPQINQKSRKMVQGSFEQRQEAFESRRQESIKKYFESAKKDCPHRPKLNKNSSAILKKAQNAREYLNKSFNELDPELGIHGIRTQVNRHQNPRKRETRDPEKMKVEVFEFLQKLVDEHFPPKQQSIKPNSMFEVKMQPRDTSVPRLKLPEVQRDESLGSRKLSLASLKRQVSESSMRLYNSNSHMRNSRTIVAKDRTLSANKGQIVSESLKSKEFREKSQKIESRIQAQKSGGLHGQNSIATNQGLKIKGTTTKYNPKKTTKQETLNRLHSLLEGHSKKKPKLGSNPGSLTPISSSKRSFGSISNAMKIQDLLNSHSFLNTIELDEEILKTLASHRA